MKRKYKYLTAAAMTFCLNSQVYSMEAFQSLSLENRPELPNKRHAPLIRCDAYGDLTTYFAKRQFAQEQMVVESPRITFPDQKDLFVQSIQQGCTKLHIYIPRNSNGYTDDYRMIDLSFGDTNLSNVTSLVIEHSAGESMGYWPAAVEALASTLRSFPNLLEVTLSDILVDDVVPHLEYGTRVKLNSGCYYVSTDRIYPKEFLSERAEAQLDYYQRTYSRYPFSLATMQNPMFTIRKDGLKVSH